MALVSREADQDIRLIRKRGNTLKKAGLVLEGGGNRGIFTSGVLDYLMEERITFPYVVGVSAGACNAVDFVSEQIGRTKDCIIGKDFPAPLIRYRYLLEKRMLVDMDLLFDEVPNRINPFDYDTYFASPIRCVLVATDCTTGKAVYMDERKDRERLMKIVRASSSLPLVSPMVTVDDIPYLDGGISDPIPVRRVLTEGYKKPVIVLTRQAGYRKKLSRVSERLGKILYKEYPEVLKCLQSRHRVYNKTMDLIERLEQEGRAFVFRPSEVLVGRTEENEQKLNAFYQQGYELAKERIGELREFLESE